MLNFIALFLSIFALIIVLNVINIEDKMNMAILNTFPNSEVYSISKNGNQDLNNGYNIVQKVRPNLNELKSIEFFANSNIDYDLSYLLDNYTYKKDNLIINEKIIFEPHFLSTENFYVSGLDFSNSSLEFSKDFKIFKDGEEEFETFKWNITNYEFISIKVFNFLNVPTIYYPYNLLKNSAETTYFSSVDLNLYEFISKKGSNEIETNYSLIGVFEEQTIKEFNHSQYKNLYEITNRPYEISNNFMSLFSTIIDFGFYFLIVIIVLVLVLLVYTLYLIILKNHKETALLRSYGKSKSFINMIYRFEILILFFLSFIFAVHASIGAFSLVNNLVLPSLNFNFIFKINIPLTCFVLLICLFLILTLTQIPLIKVNRINIRKELNSL